MGTFGASATLVYGHWSEQDFLKFESIRDSQLWDQDDDEDEDDWIDYWELEDYYKNNLQKEFPLVELDVDGDGFLFFCKGLKIHSYVDVGGQTTKPISDFIAKITTMPVDIKVEFAKQLSVLLPRFVPGATPKCDWLLEASLFGPG